MTGIELIAKEREEQINKHGYTVEKDIEVWGTSEGLIEAAIYLAEGIESPPTNFNEKVWKLLYNKSKKEQLIIAGAWIAAQIDIINELEKTKE